MAAKSTRGVTSETQKLEMLKALTFGRNDWCGLSSLFCYNLMCLSHQEKGRWVRKLVIQLKSAVWRDITDYMKRLGIGPRVVFWPITPCTCYAKLRMFILRVDGKDDPKASGQFQVLRGQYSEYSSYVFASENATLVFATLVFVPWNPGDIGDNHAIGCNRMQELPVSAQLLCWLLLLTQRGWSETEKKKHWDWEPFLWEYVACVLHRRLLWKFHIATHSLSFHFPEASACSGSDRVGQQKKTCPSFRYWFRSM